jgi:hypothetical protein
MESVGYKRVLDEANAVHSEQMVGKTMSNSTKISTNLFSSGKQHTHQNLLSAVLNLHGALTFMIDPSKDSSSCIIKDLEELFAILVSHEFRSWFNYHLTSTVMWLCHSILVDIHNVFCHIIAIVSMPAYLWAVLEQQPIKASEALADLDIAFKTTILKWNTAVNQNALLLYNSEPSTWQLLNLGCSDSSKKQCTNKTSNKDKGKGKTKLWGSFNGHTPPRASNLNLSMIEVTNALLAPLHSIPCLHSNKPACHDFICCKGHSCLRGCNCNFKHLTTWSDVGDINNLHHWASTTDGVMWIAPVPNHC